MDAKRKKSSSHWCFIFIGEVQQASCVLSASLVLIEASVFHCLLSFSFFTSFSFSSSPSRVNHHNVQGCDRDKNSSSKVMGGHGQFQYPIEPPTKAQSPPPSQGQGVQKLLLNGSLGSSLEMNHKTPRA